MGCKTLTTEQSLESKAKAVAFVATSMLLSERQHPEWRPHFELARDDLRIILESETLGLAEVLTIVQRLPVLELRGEDAMLIIGASMIFFEDELGRIAIDNPPRLRAICRGLISGITLGLPPQ